MLLVVQIQFRFEAFEVSRGCFSNISLERLFFATERKDVQVSGIYLEVCVFANLYTIIEQNRPKKETPLDP